MISKSAAVLAGAYVLGMLMVASVSNAEERYPTSDQLKSFIEMSTDKWLEEKGDLFATFFKLEIEAKARSLFSKDLTAQLIDETSKSLIISSFPDKKFDEKQFFSKTSIFTHIALDSALVFQIYLYKKIEDVVRISDEAVKEVTENFGCQTPPCDFKFWCKCFYPK